MPSSAKLAASGARAQKARWRESTGRAEGRERRRARRRSTPERRIRRSRRRARSRARTRAACSRSRLPTRPGGRSPRSSARPGASQRLTPVSALLDLSPPRSSGLVAALPGASAPRRSRRPATPRRRARRERRHRAPWRRRRPPPRPGSRSGRPGTASESDSPSLRRRPAGRRPRRGATSMMSATWCAIPSSAARTRWARVVPRVRPQINPRASASQCGEPSPVSAGTKKTPSVESDLPREPLAVRRGLR